MTKCIGLAGVERCESIGIPTNRYYGDGIKLLFQTHLSVKLGLVTLSEKLFMLLSSAMAYIHYFKLV